MCRETTARRRIACSSSAVGLIAKESAISRKLWDVVLQTSGSGPVDCRLALPQETIAGYFAPEVRKRVRVVPFVKRSDMPALYAEHDIFVFPSLAEGMPLTLLEAMATGMPIVTTDAPGMADLIEDEFNGMLVQPAHAGDLADAIERLCLAADLRRQFGQAAQQTARRYTWPIVTRKLERRLLLAASHPGALN